MILGPSILGTSEIFALLIVGLMGALKPPMGTEELLDFLQLEESSNFWRASYRPHE